VGTVGKYGMGKNKIEFDAQRAGVEVIDRQEPGLLIGNELTDTAAFHCFLPQPFVGIDADVVSLIKVLNEGNSEMKTAATNLKHF
jgi:hypothetical protein